MWFEDDKVGRIEPIVPLPNPEPPDDYWTGPVDCEHEDQFNRIEAKLDALIDIQIKAIMEQLIELIEWKRKQERQ